MSQTPESAPTNRKDESKKKAASHRARAARGFSRAHAFGLEIAVAIIAPMLVGRWLDSKTGKEPWFMIGGMILGIAAAIRSAQRFYKESQEDNTESKEPSDTEQPK